MIDDEALLDLVLSRGKTTQSSRRAAQALLATWPTLAALAEATPEGIARATRRKLPAVNVELLRAAIELGRRAAAQEKLRYQTEWQLTDRATTMAYVAWKFQPLASARQEEFHIVTLNAKSYPIATHQVSKGLLKQCLVHPREVFAPAIADRANAIVAVHNHPSGIASPSPADIDVTQRLKESGDLLGIELLDHIIVTRNGCGPVMQLG